MDRTNRKCFSERAIMSTNKGLRLRFVACAEALDATFLMLGAPCIVVESHPAIDDNLYVACSCDLASF